MSSGFISEVDAQKLREQRQKEWERVRTAEQPIEVPEEPQDCRSLYDKLQDAKIKKQEEWEESRKFKNTIKNLDEDECSFLELVDKSKLHQTRMIAQQDNQELAAFRQAQLSCEDSALTRQITAVAGASQSSSKGCVLARGCRSQRQLLRGAVIVARQRRSSDTSPHQTALPAKRARASADNERCQSSEGVSGCSDDGQSLGDSRLHSDSPHSNQQPSHLRADGCEQQGLPGISYSSSSSSSSPSNAHSDTENDDDNDGIDNNNNDG